MFVLQKTDGTFVAPGGLEKSYTPHLQNARRFKTRESAQAECCVENETAVSFAAVRETLAPASNPIGKWMRE